MSIYNRTIDQLFLGYDASEHPAYQVAKYTAQKYTPGLAVHPIVQDKLRSEELYWRPKDFRASNDFSLTRYLTPHLAVFGLALFTDCDMVFTQDLNELVRGLDFSKAVWVVKHEYTPKTKTKMNDATQHTYPKKNWSSVMLFNCGHPAVKILTPEYINNAQPSDLHQFKWLDGSLLGALPVTYNFLVGEYNDPDANADTLTEPTDKTPAILHYTLGVPHVHEDLVTLSYSQLFERYYDEMRAHKALKERHTC